MTIHRTDNFYRLPVGSCRIEELKRRSLWYRIKSWFSADRVPPRRIEERPLSLKKTMEMLEDAR